MVEVERGQRKGCGVAAFQWAELLAQEDRQRHLCMEVWSRVKDFSRMVLTSAAVLYMTDPSEARFKKRSLSGLRP